MTTTSPEGPDENQTGGYEHGPRPARRIPKAEYTESFLRGLQQNDQVRPVAEDWKQERSNFPPHVNWVIYPNGDLERIGFD